MSGGPVPVFKKYTATSKGIWEKLRQWLVMVPNRSTGNPVVPFFRIPSPGSRPEAAHYTDPVTIPSGDIAGNPYFKRDHRRNYPQIAHYSQSQIAGLLAYGSVANPRIPDGQAGEQALAKVESGELSLVDAVNKAPNDVLKGQILDKNGLPPMAPTFKPKHWRIVSEDESGMYTDKYPVRSFT